MNRLVEQLPTPVPSPRIPDPVHLHNLAVVHIQCYLARRPTAPLGLKGKDIPLGRIGMPQDMADLIRFVVGPGASYITGQTIHSNGGAFLNL